jgi:3-mercaptopyruvate sulfurtransferase SseA
MIQWRAWALAQMGARDEAVKILRGLLPQWHREQEPQSSMPEAVYYLRKLGLESESVALAEHILARVDQKNFLRGYTFVARGRLEEGLPFLIPCPSGHLQRVYWSPLFDDWRDDERFKRAIVQWPESAAYAVARESLAQILKTPAAAK